MVDKIKLTHGVWPQVRPCSLFARRTAEVLCPCELTCLLATRIKCKINASRRLAGSTEMSLDSQSSLCCGQSFNVPHQIIRWVEVRLCRLAISICWVKEEDWARKRLVSLTSYICREALNSFPSCRSRRLASVCAVGIFQCDSPISTKALQNFDQGSCWERLQAGSCSHISLVHCFLSLECQTWCLLEVRPWHMEGAVFPIDLISLCEAQCLRLHCPGCEPRGTSSRSRGILLLMCPLVQVLVEPSGGIIYISFLSWFPLSLIQGL